MFSAAGISASVQVSQTYTASTSWVAPTGVTKVSTATGYGARGTNSTISHSTYWAKYKTRTLYRWDGGTEVAPSYAVASGSGYNGAADYCDPIETFDSDPTYNFAQNCYHYDNTDTVSGSEATTGASTTAFSKTFPGATGNVAPVITTFTDIAVTPGTSYPLTIPSGGSLTIIYTK
jgi:hypothetical protein